MHSSEEVIPVLQVDFVTWGSISTDPAFVSIRVARIPDFVTSVENTSSTTLFRPALPHKPHTLTIPLRTRLGGAGRLDSIPYSTFDG